MTKTDKQIRACENASGMVAAEMWKQKRNPMWSTFFEVLKLVAIFAVLGQLICYAEDKLGYRNPNQQIILLKK